MTDSMLQALKPQPVVQINRLERMPHTVGPSCDEPDLYTLGVSRHRELILPPQVDDPAAWRIGKDRLDVPKHLRRKVLTRQDLARQDHR